MNDSVHRDLSVWTRNDFHVTAERKKDNDYRTKSSAATSTYLEQHVVFAVC